MNSNIENKLSQMLSGVDSGKLKRSVEAVSRLLETEEGRKLKASMSEKDRDAIMEKFMKMDAGEVREKLKNSDLTRLDTLSADDILNKLK